MREKPVYARCFTKVVPSRFLFPLLVVVPLSSEISCAIPSFVPSSQLLDRVSFIPMVSTAKTNFYSSSPSDQLFGFTFFLRFLNFHNLSDCRTSGTTYNKSTSQKYISCVSNPPVNPLSSCHNSAAELTGTPVTDWNPDSVKSAFGMNVYAEYRKSCGSAAATWEYCVTNLSS